MSASIDRMDQAIAGQPSKSAKIRALHTIGCSRSEIARYMDVKYQFVRNVLVEDEKKKAELQRTQPPSALTATTARVQMDAEGRVIIPEAFRTRLGLKPDDTLIVSLEQEELHLRSIPAAVRKAQAIVRRFVPEGVSLVDELLEDRRREVEAEDD